MIIRYLSWWYDFCHLTEKKNYIKMKLYIISNRLPQKVAEKIPLFSHRSEGGLTTGLNSLQGNYEKTLGGGPESAYRQRGRKTGYLSLREMNLHPMIFIR